MLISIKIGCHGVLHYRVVGLCHYYSSMGQSNQIQIIDGAHPSRHPFPFSRSNLDWCCGEGTPFTTVTGGFVFWPSKKKKQKINQDSENGGKIVPEHIKRFHIFCLKNHQQFFELASLAEKKNIDVALSVNRINHESVPDNMKD